LFSFALPSARFRVEGTLVMRNTSIVRLEGVQGTVHVRPGGTAVIESSLLVEAFSNDAPLRNEGTAVLRFTSLFADAIGLDTAPGASTTVAASVLLRCTGDAPTSLGANVAADTSCALGGPGDVEGLLPAFTPDLSGPVTYDLPAGSPLIDAVPVGVHGCGAGVDDDMEGDLRPVDGDGDGVAACDIGAREQPAP
jgi:hypothetical protein